MPTELDLKMNAMIALLTNEGGPLALGSVERFGRRLPIVAGALLVSGTLFYWRVEGWTIVESLYFSVVTLTTVGFGDLTPTTPGAQIFTIFYILTGIGVFVALLASVAQQYIAQKSETPSARERLNSRRQRRQGE